MGGLSTKDNGPRKKEAQEEILNSRESWDKRPYEAPDMTTILSTLAHDLRSPLNTIIGFSDVLYSERMGKLNNSQKKQLRIILERSTELLALFDDLVEYSRVLSHRTEVCISTISLNSLLKNAVERLRTALPEEGPELTFGAPETSIRIKGEEQKLAQLFQSVILGGAALFRPREIRVTVEDHAGETVPGVGNLASATIGFLNGAEHDPEQFFNWNVEGDIPGSYRLHVYLAHFYLRAMGGGLTVTSEGDCTQFLLNLCKVPL